MILYCFDIEILEKWSYINKEKELTYHNQNGILFDRKNKQFLNFYGKPVSIKGKIIFPRTGSTQIYEMNEEIIKQGGIPILSNDEIKQIDNWPQYYHGNRKIQIIKGKDLIDKSIIEEIKRKYGTEIFLKTKEKNFSSVIPISLLQDPECVFYKTLLYHLDEEFIISEKMELVKDQYGTKEYRCFVQNHQVINISRLTDTILHQIDEKVFIYASKIVVELKGIFPSYYVLDIVEKWQDGRIKFDIVEFNPIHCSGSYLYNSIMEQSLDILHNNIWNLPNEKKGDKQKFSLEGSMSECRSNLYDYRNGFASDLRSMYLIGSRGIVFSEQKELGINEFSYREVKIGQFTEIMDESDLITECHIHEEPYKTLTLGK